MEPTVCLIGTLDTKGPELLFLKEQIQRSGLKALVIDMGILGEPPFEPTIPREEVARRGGSSIELLKKTQDESHAQEVMSLGLKAIVMELLTAHKIHGFIAIGGGQGSSMASPTLKALPIGFPKILVSTKVTQAGLWPYIGPKDVVVIPPVADLAGLNRLTKIILANAASAMIGMVTLSQRIEPIGPLVVMSMNGTVTETGLRLKDWLEQKGYEVVVFHSIGTGGYALEEFLMENDVKAVVELAVNEINCHLFEGKASAGPNRLQAAGKKGIPQLLVPGSADFINFLGPETLPKHYLNRKIHRHSKAATLVRTSPQENRKLGEYLAQKLNQARGKALIVWPKRGLSSLDKEGLVFWDKEADQSLLEALKANLDPSISIREVDAHINDPEFSKELIRILEHLTRT